MADHQHDARHHHERQDGDSLADAARTTMEGSGEQWTAMRFPADGTYVVPGMLAPLEVRDGVGRHVEPNVWMLHSILAAKSVGSRMA